METDKTFTFPFGETPVSVIRERLASESYPSESNRVYLSALRFKHEITGIDLCRILVALDLASQCEPTSSAGSVDGMGEGYRNLRISILAALGIDEGGE